MQDRNLQQDAVFFEKVFGGRDQALLDERNDEVHETTARLFGDGDKFGGKDDQRSFE
jgi:hypothetical protein